MTDKNRKLWLDTRGVPVITTTKNGEANAIRWGWTEARAVPADALATRVPVQGEPNARVVTRSLDSDCALGVCMRGCSHLMWLCDTCSSEGGWGATRDKLKKWAAEHVCPQPPAAQGEPNDDREAMLRRIESFDYDSDRVSDDLEQDIRALVAISRANVPDAATELRAERDAAQTEVQRLQYEGGVKD